jgi:hypothetical protein
VTPSSTSLTYLLAALLVALAGSISRVNRLPDV